MQSRNMVFFYEKGIHFNCPIHNYDEYNFIIISSWTTSIDVVQDKNWISVTKLAALQNLAF